MEKVQKRIVLRVALAFLVVTAGVLLYNILSPTEFIENRSQSTSKFNSPEEFGRALFFDSRLSRDNSISCASCHIPDKAFTDGRSKSIGVRGRMAMRNAPTLLNVGSASFFMFDAHIKSLEEQAIVPIQDSNEMDLPMGDLIDRLKGITIYTEASRRLYNRDIDAWVVTRALASFQRTLKSDNSPFDQYLSGDRDAISTKAQKGWKLFQRLKCLECHQLPHFTDYKARNNGVFSGGESDKGKFRIAGDSSYMGAFKVATLRNVALTAPYMHDGSFATLTDVIQHYNTGGSGHWNQDSRVKKQGLSDREIDYLINFLESLTDTSYMKKF
jgi:cytochrome c peroxidase